MSLQDTDHRLGLDQAAEGLKTYVRGSPDRLDILVERGGVDAPGIRDLDYLAPLGVHHLKNLFAHLAQRTRFPVVTVDDIVRLEFFQIRNIAPILLGNNFANPFDILNNLLTLIIGKVREAFVFGDGLVRQQTDDDITVFSSFMNNMDQPRMHDIRGHTDIDFLVHIWKRFVFNNSG